MFKVLTALLCLAAARVEPLRDRSKPQAAAGEGGAGAAEMKFEGVSLDKMPEMAAKAKEMGLVKSKSEDPYGDPVILRLLGDTEMEDELEDYDMVIVHYYNVDYTGAADAAQARQIFRNAQTMFREELKHRVETLKSEPIRRVRFAEVDYSP